MGSRKAPRLSPAEIVARYLGGEGRGTIGLRAGLPDHRVKEILLAAGVTLRSQKETVALIKAGRRTRQLRNPPKRRRDPHPECRNIPE